MITLEIPDMSCGHCKATVEKALASVDPAAAVTVDLAARRASVDTGMPVTALIAALDAAGFAAHASAG
jgi:copper chaperone